MSTHLSGFYDIRDPTSRFSYPVKLAHTHDRVLVDNPDIHAVLSITDELLINHTVTFSDEAGIRTSKHPVVNYYTGWKRDIRRVDDMDALATRGKFDLISSINKTITDNLGHSVCFIHGADTPPGDVASHIIKSNTYTHSA